MEFIRNWITGICGAAILTSVLSAIAPKNSSARIIRLCGAVALTFAVFAPLRTVDAHEIEDYIQSFDTALAAPIEIEKTNEVLKSEIIEEKLTAYILQRTKQMGIDCEVSVRVAKNEQENLMPNQIIISCKETEQETLLQMIQNECGIKPTFRIAGSERDNGC